jgi:hypothetical protein
VVPIAQLWNKDSDSVRALVAQRPRQKARLVIKLLRGGFDAIACDLGNGSSRNIVENNRDGCGIKPQMSSQLLQTHSLIHVGLLGFFASLGG